MANSEDQLLVELARRNWIILATFVVVSLVVAGPEFTLGVAGGGLTAVCGYQWLYQSLRKALAAQGTPAVKGFQVVMLSGSGHWLSCWYYWWQLLR